MIWETREDFFEAFTVLNYNNMGKTARHMQRPSRQRDSDVFKAPKKMSSWRADKCGWHKD